jgi:hypothetical protein
MLHPKIDISRPDLTRFAGRVAPILARYNPFTGVSMTEEQKRIVLEQRAGFKLLEEFETQELRRMTFEERLAGFRRIQAFRKHLPPHDSRADDDEVAAVWTKIRDRFKPNSR